MTTPRRSPHSLSGVAAFAVLAGFTLMFFLRSGKGMMDDPGLGWHLAIADRMWEVGGFLYTDTFSTPSLGKPFVTYSWLGDVLMWLCEKWGGLNAVGVLTSLTFAVTLQILFQRMTRAGIPWIAALAWTWLAASAFLPMCLAVPNMFTYLGIAISVAICEQFHAGTIDRRGTLWLVPLFLLWTNMHSGFLSGTLVLATTYAAEAMVGLFAAGDARRAARERLVWWTGLGFVLLLVTLINPNGWHLLQYLVHTASDPFMQRRTTFGWLPPDFLTTGWGWAELAVLLFPVLLALSRHRVSAVALALCVVFLHYGLTGMRYTGLWVVIATPTLASLADATAMASAAKDWLSRNTSAGFRAWFATDRSPAPLLSSFAFAVALLVASRWLPPISQIGMPTAALDKLLEVSNGQRVFHDANWGGYLTWYGRKLSPPFETWIDDRIDVHGQELLVEYRDILNARYGWDAKLEAERINLVCLPLEAEVVPYLRNDPNWVEVFADQEAVIFRRRNPLS